MAALKRLRLPAGLLVVLAASVLALGASTAQAAFGLLPGPEGFDVNATEVDGSPAATAGSHPYAISTTIAFNRQGPFSDGDVKDIRIDHPAGLIENPTVVGKCQIAQFNTPRQSPFQVSRSGESCPDNSQIGTIAVQSSFGAAPTTRTFGLFNLAPPPGFSALIGASPFGIPILFAAKIDSAEGTYRLSLQAKNISQRLSLSALKLTTWATPGWSATIRNAATASTRKTRMPTSGPMPSSNASPRPNRSPRHPSTSPVPARSAIPDPLRLWPISACRRRARSRWRAGLPWPPGSSRRRWRAQPARSVTWAAASSVTCNLKEARPRRPPIALRLPPASTSVSTSTRRR